LNEDDLIMNLDYIRDRVAIVNDLVKYSRSIIDKMVNGSDVNDWRTILSLEKNWLPFITS